MILKLGIFLVAVGLVKLLVALAMRAKEKEVKNDRRKYKSSKKGSRRFTERTCGTPASTSKDISRWENGAHVPTVEMLVKICRELNASADEILEIEVRK